MAQSTARLNGSQNDRFSDIDTLRELCGCFINISLPADILIATLAHYTVREYLDLTRMSSTTASFTTCKKDIKQKFMEITFSEAHNIESNELWKWQTALEYSAKVDDAIYEDFNSYFSRPVLNVK